MKKQVVFLAGLALVGLILSACSAVFGNDESSEDVAAEESAMTENEVIVAECVVDAQYYQWQGDLRVCPMLQQPGVEVVEKEIVGDSPTPLPVSRTLDGESAVFSQATVTQGSSLKYDETGCDALNLPACVPAEQSSWWSADSANRHLFPAIYLRNAQSGDLSPAEAIIAIQQMAAGWATTWDAWTTLDVDPVYPTLVWCPQRDCTFVPDTAFPLLQAPGVGSEWYFSIAVVSAHLPADPPAGQTTISCPSGDCWAVALH